MPGKDMSTVAASPQTLRSRVLEGQTLVGAFVNLGSLEQPPAVRCLRLRDFAPGNTNTPATG